MCGKSVFRICRISTPQSGQALLTAAREGVAELSLWTFQSNTLARRFYERQGFTLVELTDGAANEERLPDALYRWVRT
jgi:putative acetyltransferase